MNKEEVLVRSRNEDKGMDTMELQSLEKTNRIATRVDMLLCCFIVAMEVAVTEQVGMESWLIYFDILSTLFLMKYRFVGKRHELFLSIFYTALFLMFLVLFL